MPETLRNVAGTRVEIGLAPVWDAQVDLERLVGIIGAVIYLGKPDKDDADSEKREILEALSALQEKIAEHAEGLAGAIREMQIVGAEKKS
jgi:hypothetical protein